MRCGFEDSNYFSVVFNREVGDDAGSVGVIAVERQSAAVRHAEADNVRGK